MYTNTCVSAVWSAAPSFLVKVGHLDSLVVGKMRLVGFRLESVGMVTAHVPYLSSLIESVPCVFVWFVVLVWGDVARKRGTILRRPVDSKSRHVMTQSRANYSAACLNFNQTTC